MPSRSASRFFLICFLGSLVLDLVATVLGLIPGRSDLDEKVAVTAILSSSCTLAAFGAATALERRHCSGLATAAVALVVITYGATLPAIWIPALENSGSYLLACGYVAVVAGLATHLSLVSMRKHGLSLRWFQILAMSIAFLLAVTIVSYMFVQPSYPASIEWEMGLILLVFACICTTLAVPVLRALRRKQAAESTELNLTVVCPRCNLQQKLPDGDSCCAGCKLRFKIEIEEPRCLKCGYLLYKLTDNRCPECGTGFENSEGAGHMQMRSVEPPGASGQ